jgi:hypothetical protein
VPTGEENSLKSQINPRAALSIAARTTLWYTPLRRFLHYRFDYNFFPGELGFLVRCLDETRNVPGDVIEIGCASGHTTCFLNRHMQASGIHKDYYCIDTFNGFTREDVAFEVSGRGKRLDDFRPFKSNSVKRFEYTLKKNGCRRTFCVPRDVQKYHFDRPVSFCVLDVDLYRPTSYALNHIWPVLSPGAIVVVDDCKPNNKFDGALQAYAEFTDQMGLSKELLPEKLGVLRKAFS